MFNITSTHFRSRVDHRFSFSEAIFVEISAIEVATSREYFLNTLAFSVSLVTISSLFISMGTRTPLLD